MRLHLHLELEKGVDLEWRVIPELGLGLGLKPEDIDKLQESTSGLTWKMFLA